MQFLGIAFLLDKQTKGWFMKPQNAQYDAIVVGSGPGGATVARDLSNSGQKVLMLERGDYKPIKEIFGNFSKGVSFPDKVY